MLETEEHFCKKTHPPTKNVFLSIMNYSNVWEYTGNLMLIYSFYYYQYPSRQRSYFIMQKSVSYEPVLCPHRIKWSWWMPTKLRNNKARGKGIAIFTIRYKFYILIVPLVTKIHFCAVGLECSRWESLLNAYDDSVIVSILF